MTGSTIRKAIESATQEVFETMLGAPVTIENTDLPVENDVVSFVGLTGNWTGTGTISCSPAVACLIAVRMLLLEQQTTTTIDDEVLDAVAELTNMVIGNVKNLLSSEIGEMALSIPTVVYGRNFRFKNFSGVSEQLIVFGFEGHRVQVKLCLTPNFEHNPTLRPRVQEPLLA